MIWFSSGTIPFMADTIFFPARSSEVMPANASFKKAAGTFSKMQSATCINDLRSAEIFCAGNFYFNRT
jgi:hypothetical protein